MRLEAAQKILGWVPERHSIAEVDAFSANMKKLEYNDPNHPSVIRILRDPTAAEKRFIRNEIQMCNPPEAPIWMGDYTFKPLGEIKIGDEIIGWEREARPVRNKPGKTRSYERFKRTNVLEIYRRRSPLIKVLMESGKTIRCTPDHLWSNGASYRSQNIWCCAKVGRVLRRVIDIYPNEPSDLRTAAWLGGLYDGEGSGRYISQSRDRNGDICTRIEQSLESLGIPYSLYYADNKERIGRERRCDVFQITGRREGAAKFAAWCKPVRLRSLDEKILLNLRGTPDRIVAIEPDGEGEVISMRTGTGNYVAWGYASKNCACDADYWLTRYAYIRDETNTIRRFQWRIPQQAAYYVIQDMEAHNRSIEIQWLKGRQLGVSTIIELLLTHRVLFGYGINAVIASIDADKSQKMAGMVDLAIAMCPWWLKPTEGEPYKKGRVLTFENQCSISIQSGNQMSGIARGNTPTCVHLSELADFVDPATLVEASLFRAVHPSPKVFMNLESTGNSNVGWWAETWRFNKANWHLGKARLRPVFLPWYMGVDIYPMPTWLHDHPVMRGWKPMEETVAHVNKCNAYTRNTPLLSEILGKDWTLPVKQAWFWECNYLEHKAKRIEKKWLQEMPADDYEALQSRQEKVFPYEVLTRIDNEREREYDVYAVVGEGIEDKFYPMDTDIDYSQDRPRIPITWNGRGKTYRWTLVPLDIQDIENPDALKWNHKLMVYRYPEIGKKYSVGIDTGGGGGLDRTVISVDEVNEGMEPDVQVAEIASDQISAAESYAFALAICAWYDAWMIACEQIRKPGDICQLQMKQMGWPTSRVHKFVRYDGKKVQKSKATKLGWYTTSWSRPLLLSMFIAAVENGWYKPNSKFLHTELDNFEARQTDSGLTKMEHADGKHDDRLFAAAISYFIAHDLEKMIERSKQRYSAPEGKRPELVMGYPKLGAVPFTQFYGNKYPGHTLRG